MQQKNQNSLSADSLTRLPKTDASLPISTAKPFADASATPSNPRLPVELLSRNGKIKSFIGAIAMFNFKHSICIAVESNKSIWIGHELKKLHEEKLMLNEFLFKDIYSKEFFKSWTAKDVSNFLASINPPSASETKLAENTNEDMAKKTGKIKLAKELLAAGKTPAQVAARLVQSFKVSPETAKNTTAWCKSMLKKESAV